MIVLDILFYIFIVIVIIQIFYYGILFSKFAFHKPKKVLQKKISVSVLVCAKNEAENLKAFIPSILAQDYDYFELILINDGSNDNTLTVMKSFEKKNDFVKVVDVKPIDAFWGNKKYALTLGIKAASHNFLLFTDADCKPVSDKWISRMISYFDKQKTIVIGYGAYKKTDGFLNKLIRFETLMTATQYFSYALAGIPYMAVGRNLAYKKEEFFKARGFMNHMDIRSGDDDLFVNQVSSKENTAICFTKDSFTESIPETSFKNWVKQKRRHISTASRYKLSHKLLLGLFYLSQFLFWTLVIILLTFLFHWKTVLALITIRFMLQFLTLNKIATKLKERDTLYILPLLEVFLIIIQMVIFITNLTTKNSRWK